MKFKHADIPAALALVREQLEEEGKRLFVAGAIGMYICSEQMYMQVS